MLYMHKKYKLQAFLISDEYSLIRKNVKAETE